MSRTIALTLFVVALDALIQSPLVAQRVSPSTERSYAADASADAYRLAESRRRAEFAQHVGTIEYVRWLNGRAIQLPLGAPYPADRAAYYGYGGRFGRAYPRTVFEPWPYLPGDIWGFSYGSPRTLVGPNPSAPPPKVTRPSATRPAVPPAEPAAEAVRRGPVSY